jgi:hypothetical protein
LDLNKTRCPSDNAAVVTLLEDQLELDLVFDWTSPHAEKRDFGLELA